MFYFVLTIFLYVLLEILQRPIKQSKREQNEVTDLPSTFPFPPTLMQIDNAFQQIEEDTLKNRKMVILPESNESLCRVDAVIRKQLQALATDGIAIVTRSLSAMMDLDRLSCERPDGIVREVFFAFTGRPAMALCLVKNAKEISSGTKERIKDYVLQLTRKLTLRLRLFTDEHISVLDGVIGVTTLRSDGLFRKAVDEIVQVGKKFCNPHSLLMGEKKCEKLRRAALASVAITDLDLFEILKLNKNDEKGHEDLMWILPHAVFNVSSQALDRNGSVKTTLSDQECSLLVVNIARRWEKIQPTLLCTDDHLKEKIRQQGIVSQVISRKDIPSVKVQNNVRQLVAGDISHFEAKLLDENIERRLLINPVEDRVLHSTVLHSSNVWTSDLLDNMSDKSKNLRGYFEKMINSVFASSRLCLVYTGCQVLYFSKGSVRAHVDLFFRHDCNTSKQQSLSKKDFEKAFIEGSGDMRRSARSEERLQLFVFPEDLVDDETETDVLSSTPTFKLDKETDAFDDFSKGLIKRGVFKIKGASTIDINDLVSKLGRDLGAHDKYYGGNALYWSAVSGNNYLTQQLLSSIHLTSEIFYESLAFCISQEQPSEACLIISLIKKMKKQESGIDIDYHTGNNRTVLVQAADGQLEKVVEALLSVGANVNCQEPFGWTPLMTAAYMRHVGIFQLLLKQMSDLSIVDSLGRTVLHQACRGGNLTIIQSLLKKKSIDINARDYSGCTALMLAVSHNRIDLFQLLIDSGADLETEDNEKNTLLHISSRDGSHLIVKQLLLQTSNTSNINKRGQHGWSPLMIAAVYGRYKVFHILIENGANIEEQFDDHDNSLLHLACQGGNVDIVKELLPVYGATLVGEEGRTPLQTAAHYERCDVVNFLKGSEQLFL